MVIDEGVSGVDWIGVKWNWSEREREAEGINQNIVAVLKHEIEKQVFIHLYFIVEHRSVLVKLEGTLKIILFSFYLLSNHTQ